MLYVEFESVRRVILRFVIFRKGSDDPLRSACMQIDLDTSNHLSLLFISHNMLLPDLCSSDPCVMSTALSCCCAFSAK